MKFTELSFPTGEKHQIEIYKTEKYYFHTNFGKLIDLSIGNTSFIFGFDNPHIKNRMREIQDTIAYVNHKVSETSQYSDELIEKLCASSGYDAVAWAVSGSDGIECAIYLNDSYHKKIGKIKPQIISFYPNYHGATFVPRAFRKEDYLSKCVILDRPMFQNETEQIEVENVLADKVIEILQKNNKVGAILFESIPWYIHGFLPWSENFWQRLRKICDDFDINLILDDVLGGVGKLGHYLSQDRYGVRADFCVLGKALTGGFSPLSCVLTTDKIANVVKHDQRYSHTYSPNMAGVGAALGVLDIFNKEQISSVESRMKKLGNNLVEKEIIPKYNNIGLTFTADFVNPISPDAFVSNGMSMIADITDRLGIAAPAIADDEYFETLENRLTTLFK
jgi:adenosylmethionine-8-amino-7-oxononanoate aminotransferase